MVGCPGGFLGRLQCTTAVPLSSHPASHAMIPVKARAPCRRPFAAKLPNAHAVRNSNSMHFSENTPTYYRLP